MKLVFLFDQRFTPLPVRRVLSDWKCVSKPATDCDVLLRWGCVDGPDQAGIVLNRKLPLKNCLDKEKVMEILRLNRIRKPRTVMPAPDSAYPIVAKRCNPSTGFVDTVVISDYSQVADSGASFFVEYINTVKKYNVYVFDLQVFLLTKKIAVKTNTRPGRDIAWEYDEVPPDLDRETQRICLLAQRTIHVLGLDFGMVHIGIDVRGRPVVLDITPVPALSDAAAQRLRRHLDRFIENLSNDRHGPGQPVLADKVTAGEPAKDVVLGADPEFVLRDRLSGEIVYPSDYLSGEGCLGFDERSERREGRLFPLAEIRPEPDPCPVRLTEKMHHILEKASAVFPPDTEWLAGSLQFEKYQIGGHIHFSNVSLNSRLLRALDNYLAIPLMLIENPSSAVRRRRQYGWLGSIRPKPHGGFEYRVPGSWLVSPEITRACLCLAKIVVTEHRLLAKDFFTDPQLQQAFYQCKKYYFYDIFSELWADLAATPLFRRYEQHLVPITKLISARSHWNESADLRLTWGLIQQEQRFN